MLLGMDYEGKDAKAIGTLDPKITESGAELTLSSKEAAKS